MALWIVDSQPAKRLALPGEPIVDVIREAGHEVIEVLYDPQNSGFPQALLPTLQSPRAMLLRGSVGFAAWAHDNSPIHPGAFRSELLSPTAYLPAYGDLALNWEATTMVYGDFIVRRAEYENLLGGTLFLKPAGGGKLLSGTILEAGHTLFDAHYAQHRRWTPIPDDFPILVARAHMLRAEWRFVITGERVAARSLYKIGRGDVTCPEAPAEAEALAERIARHSWRPTEVFVADIAETEDSFRLLELNTFGTSGLYACDLEAVVQAVSSYAQ